MKETGVRNPAFGLETIGLTDLSAIYWNQNEPALYEQALTRGEACLSAGGALVADTGQHTGRSPKDKFVVADEHTTGQVWWDNNARMSREHFDVLLADFIAHAKGRDLFAQDLYGGADEAYRLPVRVYTQYAWHSLFIRNLLIRPKAEELSTFQPKMTIIDLPSFKADPARHGCRGETVIACDLTRMIVLIGGTSYAGEMKKSVFTFLNYLLPPQGVMPMHCSANVGKDGDTAVFFGLSGTGKTTLSADPERTLIGDDEHGWGKGGVFNFEGGCYAKTIKLSKEAEPEIYSTTQRSATARTSRWCGADPDCVPGCMRCLPDGDSILRSVEHIGRLRWRKGSRLSSAAQLSQRRSNENSAPGCPGTLRRTVCRRTDGPEVMLAGYSAASRTMGAASRTAPSTASSNLAKLSMNIWTSFLACAS